MSEHNWNWLKIQLNIFLSEYISQWQADFPFERTFWINPFPRIRLYRKLYYICLDSISPYQHLINNNQHFLCCKPSLQFKNIYIHEVLIGFFLPREKSVLRNLRSLVSYSKFWQMKVQCSNMGQMFSYLEYILTYCHIIGHVM